MPRLHDGDFRSLWIESVHLTGFVHNISWTHQDQCKVVKPVPRRLIAIEKESGFFSWYVARIMLQTLSP
ncbi:MAG: hypothetical protein M1294_04380 [Firmicutes bacterium]|nr:hypothetical protein [Bacillota bacterium]